MEFASDRFGRHEFDVGSSVLQAVAKCDKLISCANHFKKNHKDIGALINMKKLLQQRKKALEYLKRTEFDKYCELLQFYKMKDTEEAAQYTRFRCKRR